MAIPPWLLIAAQLLLAFALALPVAWDRERARFSAGLRTFPLVAVGAAGFLVLAQQVFPPGDAQARIVEGLVGGIGFIGGGAILKGETHVEGTATAASIWNTGAIGGTVAYGLYEVAVMLSVLNLLIFEVLARLKPLAREQGPPEGEDVPEEGAGA